MRIEHTSENAKAVNIYWRIWTRIDGYVEFGAYSVDMVENSIFEEFHLRPL